MKNQMILLLILLVSIYGNNLVVKDLNSNWNMKIVNGPTQASQYINKDYQCSLPTVIHLELLKAGDIPDPFLKDYYPTVKWVSDCTVKFSTNFTIEDTIFDWDHHQIVFQGIDTYADVKVNNELIMSTENAFRKYVKNIKKVLKRGVNSLQVTIYSTNDRDNQGQREDVMPFIYAHTRKACYQYSWDWAPYLNTIGIWKKVYIESFEETKIDYVWARTRYISKENAIVNFALALNLPSGEEVNSYFVSIRLKDIELISAAVKEKYSYHDVHITNPELWWPNGIGKPHIYDFEVILFNEVRQKIIDKRSIPFGIRTVELVQANNRFEVKVNGYSIYCKGANYVPPDMFYPRLQNPAFKPANTIENLINDAVDSNFNMIRLWGGGQYESDHFFQLASRKGIMVFYDFMFSDSIYPATEKFLLNVEEQIKQQIRRARNYPCLTLWSGNNQILQGIQDWGWAQQKYKQNYHKLFEVLIPKIIEYQSPYIPYIPSSPVKGVGNYGFQRGGDVHFWGVWAGGSDFQTYKSAVGYFNSQFGTQSLPVWQTILQTVGPEASYTSSSLLIHERHNSQFNTLKNYMRNYMSEAKNFEMEVYQSGLLQAYAIEIAIKAQRIAKPKSFGTLYWQMNDAWPAVSWSSIDYFGRWKPLQYMAKRLYADVAIFTQDQNIYVVSDQLYNVNALAVIKIFSLDGQILFKLQKQLALKPNQVLLVHTIVQDNYQNLPKANAVIYTEVIAGKKQVMMSTTYNAKFKQLKLSPGKIVVTVHEQFNQMTIQTAGRVIKNLFISHVSQYAKFSNNYFDLVPGHPVKVLLIGADLATLKNGLKFRSYFEVSKETPLEVTFK